MIEVELLAACLLERVADAGGRDTLRLTQSGIEALADTLASNRASRTAHEALVERVALEMCRAGRLVWRGLSLRARAAAPAEPSAGWCVARPDVFSIRRTSVEAYLEPVVHEIKVSRADLLGDLRKGEKRAAYLELGGACWYVLGTKPDGAPIAHADEIPQECGVMQASRVMQASGGYLEVLRPAPRRPVERLPLHVWMALAKATPDGRPDDDSQQIL